MSYCTVCGNGTENFDRSRIKGERCEGCGTRRVSLVADFFQSPALSAPTQGPTVKDSLTVASVPTAPANFPEFVTDLDLAAARCESAMPNLSARLRVLAVILSRASAPVPAAPAAPVDKNVRMGLELIHRGYCYTNDGPIGAARRWIASVLAVDPGSASTGEASHG